MARGEKTKTSSKDLLRTFRIDNQSKKIIRRAKASVSTKSRFSARAIKIARIQIFDNFAHF